MNTPSPLPKGSITSNTAASASGQFPPRHHRETGQSIPVAAPAKSSRIPVAKKTRTRRWPSVSETERPAAKCELFASCCMVLARVVGSSGA